MTVWDLNPGFTYTGFPNLGERALALAEPTGIALDAGNGWLYVAAQGTDRIGVLDLAGNVVARIEVGNASGSTIDTLNKRGPRGLALHPSQPRLYVSERLSHSLTVIDTLTRTVLLEQPHAFDPMPSNVRLGSKFQYEASCRARVRLRALVPRRQRHRRAGLGPRRSERNAGRAPTQPFPFNVGLAVPPDEGADDDADLRG